MKAQITAIHEIHHNIPAISLVTVAMEGGSERTNTQYPESYIEDCTEMDDLDVPTSSAP